MSSIGLEIIEGQYARACDTDDIAAMRRVRRRAAKLAGDLTECGKYAEGARARTIAATASERINRMRS